MTQKGDAVCAIALDTKGPEIRTGTMKDGVDSAMVQQGSLVEVTVDPQYKDQCTAERIYIDYVDLCTTVKPGMTVFIGEAHCQVWRYMFHRGNKVHGPMATVMAWAVLLPRDCIRTFEKSTRFLHSLSSCSKFC